MVRTVGAGIGNLITKNVVVGPRDAVGRGVTSGLENSTSIGHKITKRGCRTRGVVPGNSSIVGIRILTSRVRVATCNKNAIAVSNT